MTHDTLQSDYEKVKHRAAALRLTERELIDAMDPPMGYVTYWRAKTNESGLNARVKVLRRVEEHLDALEGAA